MTVAAVWFAFGVDLDKYVDQVHAYNTRTGRKTFIFVNLSSVEDARRAALKGVDAVVVQAILREFETSGSPLVVAAGGISTGARIASLLTMGVDGVVLGTRFLFTPECTYTAAKKDALLCADLKPLSARWRTMKSAAQMDGLRIAIDVPFQSDGRP
ncbi:Nitronate monooxygenase [Mycena venus]|uniref:Nitronate monooxygenase n=1 Tax=Mycena venus TaxID=2733690 RepID=A0A8H7CKZ2_9AGAR|nr:Nitronate monooxygenase [Mycena venus]